MVNEFGSVSYPLRNSEMELTAVTGGPFAVNSRGVGRENERESPTLERLNRGRMPI